MRPETGASSHCPAGNLKRGRNAGFIRQKVTFDVVLPDKSGVPGAVSGCAHPKHAGNNLLAESFISVKTLSSWQGCPIGINLAP
jgi:hypothetical protein